MQLPKQFVRKEFGLPIILLSIFILTSCHLPVVVSTYSHYRLPISLQPDQYELRIITHLDNPKNLTYEGQVSIRFQVLEDTNNITLHASNLTIDASRIQLKSYEDDKFHLCLDSVETVPEHDYYILRLCQSLLKGQRYKVKLEFSGILNDTSQGYFRSSYVDGATNETKWLSATLFEPAYARRAFPCFDEPNYKARFIIWLGHHKSLNALSNMPRAEQIPMDDLEDYVWSIFEESVPMSTYVVAYSVNDLAYKESRIQGNDVVFRTWCRPDVIEQCDYAAAVGPKILQYYERLFATPFPLKKVDQIAVPDFRLGAIENWGLIVYDEIILLHKSNVSSESDTQQTLIIMAHELAHQWFGNLVTMKWWTDLWLNEGFATYVSSLAVQHIVPEFEMYGTEALLNSIFIFDEDGKLSSHPVSQPISLTKEIATRFDAISYNKGSNVLRMIHSFLGQTEFFEGVRDYLTKHKYENAKQDDLWAAFSQIAHKTDRIQPQHDMKTIMDSWTLQPGYPLVKVSRNYETGSIEISQHRYFGNSTITDKEEVEKCWWVPLTYTAASELDFHTLTAKAWLECGESGKSVNLKLDNVTSANEWILFNIQLSGIYRVIYDTENWRLIRKTLHSDRFTDIHVMNRAQIIEDTLGFAWSSYYGYKNTFDILEYLSRERELLPWTAATECLRNIFFILEHFPQYQWYFKTYMRYIVGPIYYHVGGLNATRGMNTRPTKISLQNLVTSWACLWEMDDCIQTSIEYFRQWKLSKNPDELNQITVDLRETVYCVAIRHGDTEDWNFLWQRYKASKLDSDKETIIKSLGCSRNEKVLRDFMGLFANKDIIAEDDVLHAFGEIRRSAIGYPLALEYYLEHISALHDRKFNVASYLIDLSLHIASAEDQNRLLQLIESNPEYFKKFPKSVSSAVETMNLNRQWVERNLVDLVSQIQSHLYIRGAFEDNVIIE